MMIIKVTVMEHHALNYIIQENFANWFIKEKIVTSLVTCGGFLG